jgi:hypothetical protein
MSNALLSIPMGVAKSVLGLGMHPKYVLLDILDDFSIDYYTLLS